MSRFWAAVRIISWAWSITQTPDIYRMMLASYPEFFSLDGGEVTARIYLVSGFLIITAAASLLWQTSRAVRAWTGEWLTYGVSRGQWARLERWATPLWGATYLLFLYFAVDAPACMTSAYSTHGTCYSEVIALGLLGVCLFERGLPRRS